MNSWRSLFLAVFVSLVLLSGCQSGQGLTPATGSTSQPPLIPHEVDPAGDNSLCQECHRTGEGGAPKYPAWHATLVDCQQCHVMQDEKVPPFAPGYAK